MAKWRMLDLFSGIGGFSLAASWVWGDELEIVAFCEIDPYCQKVLKKHWPGVPIIPDIKELTIEKVMADATGIRRLPVGTKAGIRAEKETFDRELDRGINEKKSRIDLLTGGFPCQPASVAGKRKGKADDRWLWPEMFRVIRAFKPTWVIAENVYGLLTLESGVVFEHCCLDLESEGYEVQPFIIGACGVNAPHKRLRVWIVAHRECVSLRGKSRNVDATKQEDCRRPQIPRLIGKAFGSSRQDVADTDIGQGRSGDESKPIKEKQFELSTNGSDVADTEEQRSGTGLCNQGQAKLRRGKPANGGATIPDTAEQGLQRQKPTSEFSGRKSGLPAECNWWSVEPDVGRVAHGVPNRVDRLKSLGNAIVPQVAAVIMQAIKEAERG